MGQISQLLTPLSEQGPTELFCPTLKELMPERFIY